MHIIEQVSRTPYSSLEYDTQIYTQWAAKNALY